MISTVNLTKKFGDTLAINNLSANIKSGSVYGLVGPNGSGKSTLLRLIAGVYMPDGGSVSVNEQSVFENPEIKNKIFYLADDIFFLPKATTDTMADFYSKMYTSFSFEKYNELKKYFPIKTDEPIINFSKGMRRQSALLTALSANTEYLLLDEAFDGLDPVIRLLLKKLVADEILNKNLTVLITSHNLRELEDVCDHIGLIHKGKLLFENDIDSVKLGFCKIQAVMPDGFNKDSLGLDVIQFTKRGSVINMLIRGEREEVISRINVFKPKFIECVPLTLEEIFIGEMEAAGYDYNNILL